MNNHTTKKPVAIVLGGTNPHRALIENLQNRGYHTILVDYLDNPPAKEVADEHIRESTLDKVVVLKIAKQRNASLVIATCVDQANVTACYVGEKLGLPHPYSYSTARQIANKVEMKDALINNKIPTAPFSVIKPGFQINLQDIPPLPLVIKPADTGGSKGVRKVANSKELNNAVTQAFNVSKSKQLIVESFTEGEHIDAVSYIRGGRANLIMLRKRFGIKSDSGAVLQYFQSIIPAGISDNALNNVIKVIQQIADTFHLTNTPLHLQLIINGDDVSVIEFAPRIGGGLSYKTVKLMYGFDILNASIESYFGLQSNITTNNPKYLFSENNIYAEPCTFGSLLGIESLLQEGVIESGFCYKTRGAKVGSHMTSSDRIGSFIVKSESRNGLTEKINKAISRIKVFDLSGKDVMKRDFYKHGL